MISRKTTKLLADAYATHFSSMFESPGFTLGPKIYKLEDDKAYNYFYEREYDVWFLQIINRSIAGGTTQTFAKAIMGIHTGETIVSATMDWTYEDRQKKGQLLLKRLAED